MGIIGIEWGRVEHIQSPAERAMMERESELRKQATAYKRLKQYDKAVEFMRAARRQQYQTPMWYDIETLLRIPKYLILAGRYQEAIDEAADILRGKWGVSGTAEGNGQREARAYAAMRTHDVAAEAARRMGNSAVAAEHEQAARFAESSMPSMRVADIKDEARTCRWTIGRIGDCGLKDGPCAKWHGKCISVDGRNRKYLSIDDVDLQAVFGNDNPHGVYAVDV
ncbi:MAG: hypothetical protein IJG84_21250 [Kiritimatiellae bacterium]|nr:hypothetical protein [Kiritimatiellia bacterium]